MREHLPTNHPGRAHMLSMLADALVNQVKSQESDSDDVSAGGGGGGGGGGVRRGAEGAGVRALSPGVALSEVSVPRKTTENTSN